MSQVEVDYWENQRYRPLQGWSAPYQGGTPNYSDILGKDTITAEQVATDNFYLPQGWEWVEGQKWTVDLSGKHGHVDADGWSYGVSFESLIEQSKTRTLKSERSSAYLARRRRWIRPRICISSEINGVIALKLIWVNIVRERIVEVITNNEINYKKLSEYNARQKTIIESTLQHADSNLSEVSTNLELLNDKLQSMTAFLIERGNIENQYAKRLEALASKWINAGDPKRAAPTRRFSISFTDSSPAPASDASGGSGGSGFFNVVSRANQSIAERLNEFSSLLCDGLPKDVNAINSEVVEALSECKKEGVEIRGTILSKSRQVDNSYESYRRCVEGSQLAMMAESEALYAAMYHSSATSTRGNKFSLSSSSGGGAGTGGGATAEGAAVVVAGGGGAAAASSSGSGGGVDVFSNLQQVDVWLAMQLYNADLIELDSLLLQYNAFVKQQQKKCDKVSASVGELLKSTVKAFAFEQFRVWQDSSSMLDSVSSHGSGGSVGNPMRDGSSGSSSSSPLRDTTTTTSNSGSGSPMAGLNPMRRSSFKMEGNTNYNAANSSSSSSSSTNNTAAATASSSSGASSGGVSSGLEEVREELVLDPDFDGNEDSGLVLPSHSHLRLSDSQLHYSRAEIVQYYFVRNGEGGPTVSSSSGGSGGGSVVDSINYGEFKQALAVLTYDRVLHLLHIDASVNNNSNSSSSSGSSSAAGASGASATAGGSSEVAALADSLSVSFDKSQLLLSLNVKPCAVSPIYLPRDGYREAFEIVIPKRGGGIIPTSLTSLMTVGTQQQQQQQQQQLRSISSVLIVFEDSLNVRNWMRCLSNPFVDPNIDSPSDYDCEENEYISMSSTYSNNKGDEVLG